MLGLWEDKHKSIYGICIFWCMGTGIWYSNPWYGSFVLNCKNSSLALSLSLMAGMHSVGEVVHGTPTVGFKENNWEKWVKLSHAGGNYNCQVGPLFNHCSNLGLLEPTSKLQILLQLLHPLQSPVLRILQPKITVHCLFVRHLAILLFLVIWKPMKWYSEVKGKMWYSNVDVIVNFGCKLCLLFFFLRFSF